MMKTTPLARLPVSWYLWVAGGILALAATLFLLLPARAEAPPAAPTPAADAKSAPANAAARDLTSLINSFLRIDAVPQSAFGGRSFVLGTTGGDPDSPADDDRKLLFGFAPNGGSFPWSSFTTVRIVTDGRPVDYNLNDTPAVAPATKIGDAIVTRWDLAGVLVEQRLTLALNPYSGRPDTARIEYTAANNDSRPHEVGVRIMLDVQIGGNDGAPYFVPGAGNLTTEREFFAPNIPSYWRAFESPYFDPASLKGQGILVGSQFVAPDRFVIARWPAIFDTDWDYAIDPSAWFTSDSAVALYWNPVALNPGESRPVSTFYGLAGAGGGATWLDGPAALDCADLEFKVTQWIVNTSKDSWGDAQATIQLPAGIRLVPGESATVHLGIIPPDEARSATWRLTANMAGIPVTKTIAASASYAGAPAPLRASKDIWIPVCGPTPTPTATPRARIPLPALLKSGPYGRPTPTATPTATPTSTATPTATPTLPAGCTWFDDFAGPPLNAAWSWVREDRTHWSLGARLGYLRIITQQGDIWTGQNNARNLLLRPAPAGDYTIRTRLEFNPAQNYRQAMLLVYADDDNYVALKSIFVNGPLISFTREVGGSFQEVNTSADLLAVHLKIVKSGATYRGYFSADGQAWTPAGEYAGTNFSAARVGLAAFNGGVMIADIAADFDHFCSGAAEGSHGR